MNQRFGFWASFRGLFLASLLLLMGFLSSPSVWAYEEIVVKAGGAITGRIQYAGSPPEPQRLQIQKDQEVCAKAPKYSEKLVVSKSQGIQNVVVSLANISKGKGWDRKTVEFLQRDCQYIPHLLLVPAGGTVEIINDDPLTHNIHTFAIDNPTMNRGQPKTVRKITTTVEFPELIKVVCDVHGWMKAWWKAVEHPYFTVTDSDGRFRLDDVPPGTYRLQIWHETLGGQTREVTVRENQTVAVDLKLTAKKKKIVTPP